MNTTPITPITPITPTWIPHERRTWPYRYGTLKSTVTMRSYRGHWDSNGPVMDETECLSGTRVKIVMVSSMGDVGITDNLDAETGYGTRVLLEDLVDLSLENK